MRIRRGSKKEKGKNPFEASMIVDNPDVKVVSASYNEKPFLFGVGLSTQREVKGSGQANIKEGVKGEYQTQKDLDWKLLYNPSALPTGFVPIEKAKDWIAGTVYATSGSVAVYDAKTEYKESAPNDITEAQLALNKGLLTGEQLTKYLSKKGFELHHETPLTESGNNNAENLRIVDKEEHLKKHLGKKVDEKKPKDE